MAHGDHLPYKVPLLPPCCSVRPCCNALSSCSDTRTHAYHEQGCAFVGRLQTLPADDFMYHFAPSCAVFCCGVLCSGGDPAPKRGAAAAGGSRFQMGSTQQPQELTREQQLADIEVCCLLNYHLVTGACCISARQWTRTTRMCGLVRLRQMAARIDVCRPALLRRPCRRTTAQVMGHIQAVADQISVVCWVVGCVQATFAAARGTPRHPNKPGVTAVRCVPILPDVEAWPNKYVVVQFPEGDPAHDSRALAKVRGVVGLCQHGTG